MSDPFDVLGVSSDVSLADAKAAYRAAVRRLHPDVAGPDADPAAFVQVRAAWEQVQVLIRDRDAGVSERLGPSVPFGPPPGDVPPADPPPEQPGRGAAGAREHTAGVRADAPAGTDVAAEVRVFLAEVLTGVERLVPFRATVTCGPCAGSGRVDGVVCESCSGRGMRSRIARVNVKVPPGVSAGEELLFPGEGSVTVPGGRRGMLRVAVFVSPDPNFRRRGNDLVTQRHISMTAAALGTTLDVHALDGPARLVVPAGTQPGTALRIEGRGVPHEAGGRGDLFVEVIVDVPRDLTGRQAQLLRAFAAECGEPTGSFGSLG